MYDPNVKVNSTAHSCNLYINFVAMYVYFGLKH